MDDSLRLLLKSIVPGNEDSVIRSFKILSRRTDEDEDEDQYADYSAKDTMAAVSDVMQVGQKAMNRVYQYERYLDAAMKQAIINNIQNGITNRPTAIEAIYHYNLNWFKTTPISVATKADVADTLINACAAYAKYDSGLWKAISALDSEVLDAAEYTYDGE